jgi:hypothetical protein
LAIFSAIQGDLAYVFVGTTWVLIYAGHMLFNPATRPDRVAQSLEASKRLANWATRFPT